LAFLFARHELSIRQRPLHSAKNLFSLDEESLASRDSHRFDDKVREGDFVEAKRSGVASRSWRPRLFAPIARTRATLSARTSNARMAVMANEKMMSADVEQARLHRRARPERRIDPSALRLYGIPESEYKGDDAKMYELVHEMRVRIITAPFLSRATRS